MPFSLACSHAAQKLAESAEDTASTLDFQGWKWSQNSVEVGSKDRGMLRAFSVRCI